MASFFNEGIHTGSDEVMSLKAPELCEPCFSDCKEVTAFVYCLDCDEKFCVACGNCHKKSKISKDHKLCNLGEAPPAHLVQLMKELTTCPNHQAEEVVYICLDEDQLCCNQCANTKHRQCGKLETIEQYLKDGLVKHVPCSLNRNNISNWPNPNTGKTSIAMVGGNAMNQVISLDSRYATGWDQGLRYQHVNLGKMPSEKREDIHAYSRRVCERSIELLEQLKTISRHEVNQEMLVFGTPERVKEYLQVVHAKFESAFNTLQTNLMSECRTQTNRLLNCIQHQQVSASHLQTQIKSNQERMTSIQKYGQEKHIFLLSRRINENLNNIESSTRTLESNKTLSTLNIVEHVPVSQIVNNIVKALSITNTSPRSPSKKGQSVSSLLKG